jgi:hypothetical protein
LIGLKAQWHKGGGRTLLGWWHRKWSGHMAADHGPVYWVWISSGILRTYTYTCDIRILSSELHKTRLAPEFPDVTTA